MMGRLTQKDKHGNWGLKGVKWEQLHTGSVITENVSEKLYAVLWKLMEYEDTGLSPEEIREMDKLYTEKCRELAEEKEKRIPMKPKYEIRTSVVHKDFADGTGKTEVSKYADWFCPVCGWFVGEQYVPRKHNQQKSNYCSKCGQAIDWTELKEADSAAADQDALPEAAREHLMQRFTKVM